MQLNFIILCCLNILANCQELLSIDYLEFIVRSVHKYCIGIVQFIKHSVKIICKLTKKPRFLAFSLIVLEICGILYMDGD